MIQENKQFYSMLLKTIFNVRFYLIILVSVIGAGSSLLLPRLIGSIIEPRTLKYLHDNPVLILALILSCLLIYTIQAASTYLLATSAINAMNKMQTFIHKHLLQSNLLEFDNFQAGDLASRLTNDISAISNMAAVVFPKLFLDIIIVLGTIIILFKINLSLTILGMVLLPCIVVIILPINSKLETEYEKQQTYLGQISSQVTHNFLHIRLIKSFLGEKDESASFNQLLKKFSHNFKVIISLSIFQDTVVNVVTMITIILIITIANLLVINNKLTVAMLATYLLYLVQLIEPLTSISNGLTQISEFRAAKSRLNEILQLKVESSDFDENYEDSLIKSDITFSNVTFKYDKEKVLSNVTFTLPQGQHLAIVGPSGCGKSTILQLMLGFNIKYLGQIKIGDSELKDISIQKLRNHISYIPQDNPMFRGSLKDNLLYGKNLNTSNERLEYVLDALGLKEIISTFPKGLDTEISDLGSGISEGQKQRFNIARALMRVSDIYLMDEVTSNLDRKNEKVITEAIDYLTKGKTRITVAHRLETIGSADWLLILNKRGEVADYGRFEEISHKINDIEQLYQ